MRVLLLILLILAGWLQSARAEEPHTFWGKTAEGWLAVYRDKSSTKAQRWQAVMALGRFEGEARAAVPDLVEAVRGGPFQDEAVNALVQIGAGAEVTVPILIQRFIKQGGQRLAGEGPFGFDKSPEDSLARIGGPAVPALLEIFDGPNEEMRVSAAVVLERIGPAARAAIPSLIRAIEHADRQPESESLVLHAIRALGRIGPEARAAIPVLNGLLGRRIPFEFVFSFNVVLALDRIGAPPVRKLLDAFLREGDEYVAEQLAGLGPKAHEAVPALRAALTDKRPQVRFSAAVALAHIEPSVTGSIPVLIEALNHLDDEALEVGEVPKALAWLGPNARAALPALIGLVKKGSDRMDIFEALVQIDPEGTECVPALIEALKSEDGEIVDAAASCLGLLGPRAKEAVPALALALTREFKQDAGGGIYPQVNVARALRRIGSDAKSAVPALIGALRYRRIAGRVAREREDLDGSTAIAATEALGSFGPEARAAVPALIEIVRTSDTNWSCARLSQAAILALGQIRPQAKAAVPLLRDLMQEAGTKDRCQPEVTIALYRLAPDGKEIAERWLGRPVIYEEQRGIGLGMEGRAMVLGAMDRTSFETDWMIRRYLERIDRMLNLSGSRNDDANEVIEKWFEAIGTFGSAARLAIPRLNAFRKHPNPWVCLWAAEALGRIAPASAGNVK
jgi:HEAT repeat protein